ncbi:MAG: hypothetical protein ACPLY7_01135, partial [Microgenomates group bacterium]
MLVVLLFINPLAVPVVYAEEEAPAEENISSSPTPAEQTPPPSDPSPSPAESAAPSSESAPSPSPTAEAVTPSPEPTTPSLSAGSNDLSPTPTPQSNITTGDAEASSVTDTTVNNNQETVNGSLATPTGSCSSPEGQTNCPNDINISNSNQATVSGATDSSATTGENTGSGTGGNVVITTGDALASSSMTNDVNSNTVVATASPDLTLTPTPTETSEAIQPSETSSWSLDVPTPTPEVKDLNITNDNDGKLTNNADISSNTGNNLASENLGNVDLKTGNALAWANLINLLNTNIVSSNFGFMILDIKNDGNEIDLNSLWKQLQEQNSSNSVFLVGDQSSRLRLIVNNENKASLENSVNVCAITGDNQANQNNSASINTGNAVALANVTNVVNMNILGSAFFFGIINITGQFTGNLILPRRERFLGIGGSANGEAVFENQNSAKVENNVSSVANSGANQMNNNGGDNVINTGSAVATVNSLSLVNLNLYQNDWFYVLTNVLGNRSGKTYSWSNPGAVEETSGSSQNYEVKGGSSSTTEGQVSAENLTPTQSVNFQNQNTAEVKNNINVLASTGNNQANDNSAGSLINTGEAKAAVNLLNLINLNILSSRWFMGLVNVLGGWSGNMIYAYPDLAVSLSGNTNEVSPGESFDYVLNFVNQGYDDAESVSLKMDFPRGLSYE